MPDRILLSLLMFTGVILFSCHKEDNSADYVPVSGFDDPKVIVVVMDGARYSETWGDSIHQFIPHIAKSIFSQGVAYTRFYNNGPTYTSAGHVAITTGYYQEINNSGSELPYYHSMLQQWLFESGKEKVKGWIIASKDKLEVLSNCIEPAWQDVCTPETNCGRFGLGVGSGYRDDLSTYTILMKILDVYKPELTVINFKEPDQSGHSGSWKSYTAAIKMIDSLIFSIWSYTQSDDWYKGKTTFIITNDHGRHLDTIADGFISHGDGCEGCRHLMFFASGPGIRKNCEIDSLRELIDIPVTISKILNFSFSNSEGDVMSEMFESEAN